MSCLQLYIVLSSTVLHRVSAVGQRHWRQWQWSPHRHAAHTQFPAGQQTNHNYTLLRHNFTYLWMWMLVIFKAGLFVSVGSNVGQIAAACVCKIDRIKLNIFTESFPTILTLEQIQIIFSPESWSTRITVNGPCYLYTCSFVCFVPSAFSQQKILQQKISFFDRKYLILMIRWTEKVFALLRGFINVLRLLPIERENLSHIFFLMNPPYNYLYLFQVGTISLDFVQISNIKGTILSIYTKNILLFFFLSSCICSCNKQSYFQNKNDFQSSVYFQDKFNFNWITLFQNDIF